MIAVFGSINIDLVTAVERIAAPGETVMGGSYAAVPGGKGANQALAARRAGAAVAMVGAVGRDGFAGPALALLREAGVDLSGVAAVDAPTGAAFIAVDARGANAITVAAGANAEAAAGPLGTAVSSGGLLLLQREVPDAEGEAAARLARARGLRTVLNLAPSGRVPDSFLGLVDVMVVNEHEAADLAGFLGVPDDHAVLAARLSERFGVGATVVTLGAEGAVGWEGGAEHRAPCPRVEAVDTTAAGDSFVGFFAAALDAGLPFAQAMRRGTAAGSLACTRAGAQPSIPTAAAVDALLARSGPAGDGARTATPKLRVARPSRDLDALLPFYRDGLGLAVLGRFAGHDGFDGLMLGHAGSPYHFEFTTAPGGETHRASSPDDLLVFYLPDAEAWRAAVERMRGAGFQPVPAFNPYWDRAGRTFEDPDGNRVVLQGAAWDV